MQFDMQAVRDLALATHTHLAFIRSMNILFFVLLTTILVALVACLIICSITLSSLGQVEDILGEWASTISKLEQVQDILGKWASTN